MEACIRRDRLNKFAECSSDGRLSFRPTTMRERTVRKIEKNDFIDDRRVFDHGVEGPFQKSELTGSLSQHAPLLCALDHKEEGPFRKIEGMKAARMPAALAPTQSNS